MAELILHDLPEELIEKLGRQATQHGVSIDEELRRILSAALPEKTPTDLKPGKSLWQHLMDMPDVGEDWMFDRHDPRNATPERRKQLDFEPGT